MEYTKLLGRNVTLDIQKENITVKFGYYKPLVDEIKAFDGARWNPDNKIWTIKNNNRNVFRLQYLEGLNPYKVYDLPLLDYPISSRSLYSHQKLTVQQIITRHHLIISQEMGVGKTLSVIEALEWAYKNENITRILYVAPKSALYATELEFKKWNSFLHPDYVTYDSLKHKMYNDYQAVVFDECSKIKTPTAQRSKNAMELAERIRDKYKEQGSYIILMSGTPSPHDPTNWYNLCETACPGFIREGNVEKFKRRLGNFVNMESQTGGNYPKLLNWWDDSDRCKICGKFESENEMHNAENRMFGGHLFQNSINEVKKLNERFKGLVSVVFKKDCLCLPEKIYRIIECPPTDDVIRIAKLLAKVTPRAAQALILLRELSDGFQYKEVENESEKIECPICHGSGKFFDNTGTIECPTCRGQGKKNKVERQAQYVETPKDQALVDLLEEFDDKGRVVIYGGFQGTVDKIVKLVVKEGWKYILADGRGWFSNLEGVASPVDMLDVFQNKLEIEPIAFIGQASAAGMGLNLTASEAIIYYSNDFNAESRIQSEDRIHRPGCKGANIIDIIHLETDRIILNNLKAKRDLMNMSMEELANALH